MITILIVNYNIPEAVEGLISSLRTKSEHRWLIIDNGSDTAAPHPLTNIHIEKNDGWMGGMEIGLQAVKTKYVWVLTTSMKRITSDGDPLPRLEWFMDNTASAVTISPAWTGTLTPETHRKFQPGALATYQRIGWASPSAFWNTNFLRANLEYRSRHGWGTDYELTYLARTSGYSCWKCDAVEIEMQEHNGYGTDRRHVSLDQHEREATEEMHRIYSEKYGPGWRELLGVR